MMSCQILDMDVYFGKRVVVGGIPVGSNMATPLFMAIFNKVVWLGGWMDGHVVIYSDIGVGSGMLPAKASLGMVVIV